jgi:starch phosphorylase
LFDEFLGPDWYAHLDELARWEKVETIPDEVLWQVHQAHKAKLVEFVRAREAQREQRLKSVLQDARDLLDPEALTIGFGRRFATYKRATLLLRDRARLARILHNPERPVVLLFAGKAHPADEPAKQVLREVRQLMTTPEFLGYIIFLEDYDLQLARWLVSGVDVWLNNPIAPLEASGTSGMKATLNGALHLSELDGWWDEAYAPGLGWALGQGIPEDLAGEARDAAESDQLMGVLEQEVAPTFFERSEDGLPLRWLSLVSSSIREMAPRFSAQRMVREYAERVYIPAASAVTAAPAG